MNNWIIFSPQKPFVGLILTKCYNYMTKYPK